MTKLALIRSLAVAALVGVAALVTAYFYRDKGSVPSEPQVASSPDTAVSPSAAGETAIERSAAKSDKEAGVTEIPGAAKKGDLSFDVVSVEPTGETVVAGRSDPGAIVGLVANGKVVGKAVANQDGEWTIILDKPLEPGDYDVGLQPLDESGNPAGDAAGQRLAVSVPQDGKQKPLVVLNAPDAPSSVLQVPSAAETKVASGQTAEPQPAATQVAEAAKPAGSQSAETQTADIQTAGAPAVEAQTADAQAGAAEPAASGAEATGTPSEAATGSEAAPAEATVATAAPADAGTPSSGSADGASAPASAGDASAADGSAAPAATAPQTAEAAVEAGQASPSASPDVTADPSGQSQAASADAPAADTATSGGTAAVAAAPSPAEAPAQTPVPSGSAATETAAPAAQTELAVTVDAVEAESGKVYTAGTGEAGFEVRVYVADALLGSGKIGDNGRWLVEGGMDLSKGPVEVRADMIGADGNTVVARAAVTFERAEEEAIVLTRVEASGEGGAQGANAANAGKTLPNVIIRKGDNLWNISRRLYGDGFRYTTIYQANKSQIRNPDLIYPGQVFLTPEGDLNWKPAQ